MKTIYVTFNVPYLFREDEKFAIECKDMAQALEVSRDANSLEGIKNIRLRKCGKPRGRKVMSYDSYWGYGF